MELEGVHVHYVSFEGNKIKRISRFLYQCIRICNQIQPNILFIVEFNVCFLLTLTCKAPLKVLDIRTGSLSPNFLKRNLDNFYIRIQSVFFNKVTILSESLCQKIKLNKKNILILPLGAEEFYKGSHDYSNLNLLYIGTLNKRNIHQTIEGLGIAVQKKPEYYSKIKYTIVGPGSETDILKLKESIEKYNLQNMVVYEGLKNYNELPPYFKICNIGIAYIPITDFYNCQPATKIYEYALSGLFTIATNTYENKLAITEKNGILCDDTAESFAEAIEKVNDRLAFIKEKDIRDSLKNNQWNVLVSNILEPFLQKY
jgi:hypothetical protein